MAISRYESSVSSLGNDEVYGPGTDGDVIITGNPTTLTSDMYYNNLTINSGAFLLTNGFRVFVKNTLTINGAIGLGTFTGSVVGEPSSDIATGTVSGVETASSSIVYSVGGTGGGGVGSPGATQLPKSYRNHINSLIAATVVTPSGVVAIKGGGKGTTGSQGTTYPALTNADTWLGKAGSTGANGTGATAGGAGTAGSGAGAGGAGGAAAPYAHQETRYYTKGQYDNHSHALLHAPAGTAGTPGTPGTNGAAGTHGTPGTNGVGSTGSPGTATGATPGVGGAGGTAGSGGGLVLIVAKNITGTGKVISLGRSGSAGSVGTTGAPGTAGAPGTGATAGSPGTAGTGATNGAAGSAGSAGSPGVAAHHPALNSHHNTPHLHNTYRLHSHTAGPTNNSSTYHAGHPHPGHGHGHNAHRFTNGTYHAAHPHMQDSTHQNGHSFAATNVLRYWDGNVHGHGGYRKYQPHVYIGVENNPVHIHYPAKHSAAPAGGAAGAAGTAGTNGTNGAAGAAGTPGTNGAGGAAAPSSGTGGTGKRGGAGGGGGIIIVTETTPTALSYDTRSGLTADTDTYAAASGFSYIILNQ